MPEPLHTSPIRNTRSTAAAPRDPPWHASPSLPPPYHESIRIVMTAHGHARSDLRHLHLHRVAMAKLGRQPELRRSCVALIDKWLEESAHVASRPWLMQWREMLSNWTLEQIADVVLDPESGQTLRQCSPLAPVLTPQERWAALEEIEHPDGKRV